MLIIDLEPIFQAELAYEKAVNRFDERVRGQAMREALKEGERNAINTRHYQDQTALLTSRIKGFVEISVPGAVEAYIGAFTEYASYVNRWDSNQGSMTFKAPSGVWVTTDLPEGFIVRGADEVAVVLIREIDDAVAALQADLDT
jgi:hypothetical protein